MAEQGRKIAVIKRVPSRGLMSSLARDVRGNTLVMMAMFLIPLTGLVGSAVDISRLYVVKARLQQACDTGVLAGRKGMTTTNATLDPDAVTQANSFFFNNFKKSVPASSDGKTPAVAGFMNTSAVTFTPVKTSDSQVAGTASASVPMTISQMFGTSAVTLNVTCQARYDVADTDILFVLDTTGSMACLPGGPDSCGTGTYTYVRPSTSGGVPGYAGSTAVATKELKSGGTNVSRIEALRQAVLNFYDTFAANADASTIVRYGFVTYSSSTNVGQAILDKSSSYLVGSNGSNDTPSYQSRHVYDDYTISTSDSITNNKSQSACTSTPVRTPAVARTYAPSTGTATNVYYYWKTTTSNYSTSSYCVTRTDTLGPKWEYKKLQLNISPLISGSTTMLDPTKVTGDTLQWYGCIETPVDVPGQLNFAQTSLPSELNPDLKPSANTRWWPHLQDVEYERGGTATSYTNGDAGGTDMGTGSYLTNGAVACGKPAKRLGVMAKADITNYLYATDFVAEGGTYHDIGMIWGSRLIAPNGPWGDDTKATGVRPQPNRVIIFMTDGVMSPSANSYSMYGYENYDQRVAKGDTGNLDDYHNARFLAACAAAKARGINVWTVAIAASASTQLQTCATTTTQALYTKTGSGLSTAFASIAQHLAMLRITK